MRRHPVLIMALLLSFVAVTSVMADKMQSSSSKTSKYHRMHGKIESVDSVGGSFTVSHAKESSTFKTDSSTKYKHGTKDITLADLKTGDDVRVSFTENGTDKTAARVDVVKEASTEPAKSTP
ncbi:MAG TPA: DUF5666 domain-containing protein [Thermoanaerobaculia bacterium]|jgi:Cu/Ag efflux protein CusF